MFLVPSVINQGLLVHLRCLICGPWSTSMGQQATSIQIEVFFGISTAASDYPRAQLFGPPGQCLRWCPHWLCCPRSLGNAHSSGPPLLSHWVCLRCLWLCCFSQSLYFALTLLLFFQVQVLSGLFRNVNKYWSYRRTQADRILHWCIEGSGAFDIRQWSIWHTHDTVCGNKRNG